MSELDGNLDDGNNLDGSLSGDESLGGSLEESQLQGELEEPTSLSADLSSTNLLNGTIEGTSTGVHDHDFLNLTDTPVEYTGQAGLYPRVTPEENGLFFDAASGPQGEPGPTGATGEQGPPGEQGVQGEPGISAYEEAVALGFVGTEAEWLESLVGPEGPEGPQGIPGATGPQGEQGIPGEQGVPGVKGDTGDTGPQGEQGVPGTPGDDGLSAYEVALSEGFVGTELEWLDSLVGPQGPQGEVGATGQQGVQGDTGPQGIQGEQGIPGVKGDTGDVGPIGPEGPQGIQGVQGETGAIGPEGPTGATGPQGNQGEQGIPGVDGDDGLSAYEVAVFNGFVGTEVEWLASLEGPEGPQGEQGIQGEPGEGDTLVAGNGIAVTPGVDDTEISLTTLTSNWDVGEDMRILLESLRARDDEGIRIEDAAGNLGVFIEDTTGHVGVLTSLPEYPLHVSGTALADTFYVTHAEYGFDKTEPVALEHHLRLFAFDGFTFREGRTDTDLMVIRKGGSVGILTPDPGAALDVAGRFRLRGTSLNSTFSQEGILSIKHSNGQPFLSFHNDVGDRIGYVQGYDALLMRIVSTQNVPISFWPNGVERATLLPDGSFGIGTPTPTARLNVMDTTNVAVQVESTGGRTNFNLISPNKTKFSRLIFIQGGLAGTDRFETGMAEDGTGNYYIANGSNMANKLVTVTPLGNVGIGKIPTSGVVLDVNGLAAFSGVVQANNGIAVQNSFYVLHTGGLSRIRQSSAVGAAPVLELQQDDVSEEFINFVTPTSGLNQAWNPATVGGYMGKLKVRTPSGIGYIPVFL